MNPLHWRRFPHFTALGGRLDWAGIPTWVTLRCSHRWQQLHCPPQALLHFLCCHLQFQSVKGTAALRKQEGVWISWEKSPPSFNPACNCCLKAPLAPVCTELYSEEQGNWQHSLRLEARFNCKLKYTTCCRSGSFVWQELSIIIPSAVDLFLSTQVWSRESPGHSIRILCAPDCESTRVPMAWQTREVRQGMGNRQAGLSVELHSVTVPCSSHKYLLKNAQVTVIFSNAGLLLQICTAVGQTAYRSSEWCGLYLRLQQPVKVWDTHLYDVGWVLEIL